MKSHVWTLDWNGSRMEVHFVVLEASSAPPLLAFSPLSPFAVFADDEAVEWLCLQPRETRTHHWRYYNGNKKPLHTCGCDRGYPARAGIGLRGKNGVGTDNAGRKNGSGDSRFICESVSECWYFAESFLRKSLSTAYNTWQFIEFPDLRFTARIPESESLQNPFFFL